METMAALAHFLRHTPYQHILLLAHPRRKATLREEWEAAKLSEHSPLTCTLQQAQDARVCLVSVVEIQMHLGVDRTFPFFGLFDAVVLCDDEATAHGPVWHRIVEFFTLMDTPVLELHALVRDAAARSCGQGVIETKRPQVNE
jgi:hypothetical protein